MPWLLLAVWTATAQAALPADIPPPPASIAVDAHGEPGMWMLAVQDAQATFTVRVQAATGDDGQSSPRCAAGGLELELVRHRGDRSAAAEAWLDALCDGLAAGHPALPAPDPLAVLDGRMGLRLDDMGLSLPAPPVPRPPGVPTLPRSWPLNPLHAVVLAWIVALVACLPRRRAPWVLAAVALGLRLLLTRPWVFMGVGYPYLRMVTATGYHASDSPYGPGWGTFMGLWWYVSGAVDDHVQAVNLVLSVLCVPALWAVVRRVAPPEGAAVAAALLAGLPLAVCLARSETMFVLVAALQLTAALGVVEPRRRGAWLAASSLVLLVLLRPYQVLVAGVLIAALWARGRAVPALVASVVLAWHAVDLLAVLQQPQVPTAAGFDKLDVLTSPWRLIGPDRALRLTDPWVTPIGAWLFVPFAWRVDRRAAWWLAALGLAAAAPYAIFARPTDALRFTLPAASWWCALVGMGLVGMPTRWRAAALAITALSFVPARRPVPEPYAWTLEHAHLVAVLPSIPAREVVTYDPTFDEHGTFETWIQLRGHGVWHPGTLDDTAPGGLHWLGRFEGATILPPCAEPVDLVEIDGPSTNVEPDFGPVLVGLVRRVACGGDAAALPLDEGRHP